MHEQINKFEILSGYATSLLGKEENELREKYKDYPIYVIDYIKKDEYEHMMEVRFDSEEATITISFDEKNICDNSFLFFDKEEDEELLIDYLVREADYNFRKSCFKLPSCFLKIKDTKPETCFFFFQ